MYGREGRVRSIWYRDCWRVVNTLLDGDWNAGTVRWVGGLCEDFNPVAKLWLKRLVVLPVYTSCNPSHSLQTAFLIFLINSHTTPLHLFDIAILALAAEGHTLQVSTCQASTFILIQFF